MSNPTLRNMTAIYLLQIDKILLLYRKGSKVLNNKWIGAAGGHFEECEINDATACVLREMQEEISVTADMVENLKLRYITIRRSNGEVRQNYYFFANLKSNIDVELKSNEGILQWFDLEELYDLEMPFSAKYMIRHYIESGRYNEKLYVGVADGKKVIFTELPEF